LGLCWFGVLVGWLLTSQVAVAKSWYFDQFNVDVTVNPDASFDVVEEHTYVFDGNFHWVIRDILKRQLASIKDIVMTDENGQPLPQVDIDYDYTDDAGNQYIRVKNNFDLTDTTATWFLKYKVVGGLDFTHSGEGGYDRLYWNAVSSDRDVPIENSRVNVKLPGIFTSDQVNYLSYAYFPYDVDYQSNQVVQFSAVDIPAYTDFTIDVSWPSGAVELPAKIILKTNMTGYNLVVDGTNVEYVTDTDHQVFWPAGRYGWRMEKPGYRTLSGQLDLANGHQYVLEGNFDELWLRILVRWASYLFVPLVIVIILFQWLIMGRDRGRRGTIIPWYEPPDNLGPAEVGAIIKENADVKFLPAIVVDLAVRGFIKIKEKKGKGWLAGTTYYFYRTEQSGNFNDYESKLVEGMFGSKMSVTLNSLKDKFYTKIPEINKSLMDMVVENGYFDRDPRTVRLWHYILAALIMCLGFGLMVVAALFLDYWALIFWWLAACLMYLLAGGIMPRKSEKGGQALEQILGFKEYLYRAERYRLQDDTPETFEKFLPYAMILGVARQWADRFKDIYKTPPKWFEGSDLTGFNAVYFANHLSSMASATESGMTYVQSSSGGYGSGGGSFGGGFSGGGGGGGGSSAG